MTTSRVIVLVDDDPVMQTLAGTKLTEAGYYVRTASNGQEALEIVNKGGVSLVISDLDMPVMDGFALTEAIRRDVPTSDIPVMVITASGQSEAVDRAFAAGATSFLAKPMNWSLFVHAVKFVLRASDDRLALRAARDQAEAGAQFKDSLMSVMSHELRTPLNAIIGFGQIITQRFNEQQDNLHKEYSEYIIDSGKRLLSSVSDMLLASEARSGAVVIDEADISVGALVDEALQQCDKTLALAGVTPELKITNPDIEITGDRNLLARAIRKLVDNAVKFSPKGVKLTLGVAPTKDGGLAIVVKDDGPGIEAEKLGDAVAPFSQLDMSSGRAREGLGLGLPLVNAIAAAHGGELKLKSTLGEGTVAVISLPPERIQERADAAPKTALSA